MPDMKEFKTTDPLDYKAPPDRAEILSLPRRLFLALSGTGNPNGPDFGAATAALYSASYGVRMSCKWPVPPEGAGPYVVGVLQGHWTLVDIGASYRQDHKENLAWTLRIRQPDFLTPELFGKILEETRRKAVKKKDDSVLPWLDRLVREEGQDGIFAQILHTGPYDDEPASFARMEASLTESGYRRTGKDHFEIYLGDPRKSAPEKLKTILRVTVQQVN